MQLKGIHHVSSLTAKAQENYHFYTKVLGLRLVKKTVNQDSPSMYHLFYADELGTPGTDFTFFEIPRLAKNHNGNNSISSTFLRIPSDKSLHYWKNRLASFDVAHGEIIAKNEHHTLELTDFEGQRMTLISDEHNHGVKAGTPWDKGPVPTEHAIHGLGPVKLTVPYIIPTSNVLTDVLGFEKIATYPSDITDQPDIVVFSTGAGGNGAEIHVEERKDLPPERQGRGGVHHVAFRVTDENEMKQWLDKINEAGFTNSGIVDRFYFQSLYFTEPNGIIYELATDGPGFTTDEDQAHLGESLALPPFLEARRGKIEKRLKPLKTD